MSCSAFDVYLDGVLLDTVFADSDLSVESVKKSLIEHDGYDEDIVVITVTRINGIVTILSA